jgi:hypothetical protein
MRPREEPMSWNSDQSRLSLANAEADFAGVTMRALQNFEIDEEVAADPVYGNGSVSIGAPDGMHKCTLKFDTIPEEADNLVQKLGSGFSRVLGSVGVTMQNTVSFNFYDIVMTRVRILKKSAKLGKAGGQDPSLITFECMVLDPVQWNGVDIIDNLNGGSGLGTVLLPV